MFLTFWMVGNGWFCQRGDVSEGNMSWNLVGLRLSWLNMIAQHILSDKPC